MGEDGLFCKHCVAVGLAFASRDEEPTTPGIAGDDAVTVDLRSYLHTQAKEKLVELILEQARDDEFLRGRLLLEAAKKSGARIDLDEFRTAIESVINVGEFVDYRSMYAYSSGIQEVVDSVETLLKEGHAAEVVELAEHTLTSYGARPCPADLAPDQLAHVTRRLEVCSTIRATTLYREVTELGYDASYVSFYHYAGTAETSPNPEVG